MVFSIQDLIYQLEGAGVFEFLLPFLLIFAVVFGILTSINIFGKNKGINVIIALVVGLMAIRFAWFTQFYGEIFPRLGIGVTVLLTIMILVGMFIARDEQRYWFWGLGAIAVIIAIVIFMQTFGNLGWTSSALSGELVGWIVFGVLIIGVIIAISASSGESSTKQNSGSAIYDALFGHREDKGK